MNQAEIIKKYESLTFSNDSISDWEWVEQERTARFAPFTHLFRERCEVSIGPGWWDAFSELCREIDLILQVAGDGWKWRFVQVKEKFGGIRAYGSLYLPSNNPHVNSFDEEEWLASGNVSPPPSLWEECRAAINRCEEKASQSCEICGEPGSTKGSMNWIKCLCGTHRTMQNARDESRDRR